MLLGAWWKSPTSAGITAADLERLVTLGFDGSAAAGVSILTRSMSLLTPTVVNLGAGDRLTPTILTLTPGIITPGLSTALIVLTPAILTLKRLLLGGNPTDPQGISVSSGGIPQLRVLRVVPLYAVSILDVVDGEEG